MTLYDEKCPLMSDDVFKCQSMSTKVKVTLNFSKINQMSTKMKKNDIV